MQNPLNMESSNVIATFVYQQGLLDAQYSFAAAVGLFNSLINSILLILVNGIAETAERFESLIERWYRNENNFISERYTCR